MQFPDARYRAVVFRRSPASSDFSQSTQIELPGLHTAAAAWEAVYRVLQGPGGHQHVGGTIRPCVMPIAVG